MDETDIKADEAPEVGAELDGRSAEAELESELASVQEQLLRTAADFQNYRRRVEQQRSAESAYARLSIVEPLLSILDDLERTLEAAESGDASPGFVALRDGVTLVHSNFLSELKRLGVEPIQSVGEQFDESIHDALMNQPATDETPSGTIVGEIQKGYRMGERVIRHAKVIVAAATA